MGRRGLPSDAILGLALFAAATACVGIEQEERVGSAPAAAKGHGSKITVSITSPADGATVSGTVGFDATASPSSSISYVDFYVDGVMAFHDTTAPYGYAWDTTAEADGGHTLLAEAAGSTGAPKTDQISVIVDNGVVAPTYTVGGSVSGLSGTLILGNNGGDDLTLTADQTFTFPTALLDGASYNVTVLSQPNGQTCTVANGWGTISAANVSDVAVSCADDSSEGVQVKVASFNIENFGTSKAGKPAVMDVLVNIALRYDILLIQELSNIPDAPDNTGPVIRQYLDEINAASGDPYAMSVSPRVGGTQGEQYVILYKPSHVTLAEAFLYSDPADSFVREPYITRVQVGDEDFYITNIHTSPDAAQAEIYAQTDVAHAIDGTDPDILLVGDWNADGSYFNENTEWSGFALLGEGYENRIGDAWDTTVLNTDYTYDRLMLSPSLLDNDVPATAAPFYFDDPQQGGWDMTPILTEGCSMGYLACGSTYQDATRRVSDHYPVEITLQFGGTINPPPPPPPPPAGSYLTSFEDGEADFEMVSGAGTFSPDTCPAGTAPRTGVAGISCSSITTSYAGRAIQSVDCLEASGATIDASYWITASTNNGGNTLHARVKYLWFTDAACTTAHATASTTAAGINVPEGSYVQVTASESPPDASAGYFKIGVEVHDDNSGANTGDDWCADDVEIVQ